MKNLCKIQIITLISIFVAIGFVGCTPYRPDVQQGQVSSMNEASNLQIGMTREEVFEIMGTPLIKDSFNADQWVYVYTISKSGEAIEIEAKVTVKFDDDKVSEIMGVSEPTMSDSEESDSST